MKMLVGLFFKKGSTANRKCPELSTRFKTKKRIGKVKMMNCRMSAKIIAYRKNNDIDIQFEDGTMVRNRTYDNFRKGAIANSKSSKKIKS